jgi:hypothetical protein
MYPTHRLTTQQLLLRVSFLLLFQRLDRRVYIVLGRIAAAVFVEAECDSATLGQYSEEILRR